MMSYISRAAIPVWLSIYWFAATLFRATAFLLAIPVLVLWLFLDVLPRRAPMQSTFQPLVRRKLPRLFREGSEVFMWLPDVEEPVRLDPLEVSILAENIVTVAAGAFVYEKTKLPD
jgi:Na+/H+ antiporter NhaD/arsenite permease-like protein